MGVGGGESSPAGGRGGPGCTSAVGGDNARRMAATDPTPGAADDRPPAATPRPAPPAKGGWKGWALFVVRWGIAAAGVWYVVAHLAVRDQAWVILDPATNRPQQVSLEEPTAETAATFPVRTGGRVVDVPRDRVVNEPDVKQVQVRTPAGPRTVNLVGVDVAGDINQDPRVARFLVADDKSGPARWVGPAEVVDYRTPKVYPHARQQMGLGRMARTANHNLLWAALLVFPLTFVLTSYRWHELLMPLDIDLPFGRAFVLNMVGSFWNTCIPGSTGGDVLKALYVSKLTPHRTRAVMSVLVDRGVGLLALIIVGGVMASLQWHVRACRDVAIASAGLCGCCGLGMLVFFNPTLHRRSGLDAILKVLPKQKQVRGAVDTLQRYGRRPGLSAWSLLVSFPVHATVVTSAMLAGMAFGLPLHWPYYWVCVPVIVLAAAIPISFQGAGVMEYLTVQLTHSQGVTVSQAVALAMSVRVVQIVWNLSGGLFVLRGGFHPPSPGEAAEVDPGSLLPHGPGGEPAVAV